MLLNLFKMIQPFMVLENKDEKKHQQWAGLSHLQHQGFASVPECSLIG